MARGWVNQETAESLEVRRTARTPLMRRAMIDGFIVWRSSRLPEMDYDRRSPEGEPPSFG